MSHKTNILNDGDKSKAQLIEELRDLRQRFSHESQQEEYCLANRDGLSPERIDHFLTAGPGIVYACKISGHYPATFISQNVKTRLGYEPREFTDNPDHWIGNVHPDDLQGVLEDLKALFDREYLIHQYRFRHKDGSWRWMIDEHQVVRNKAGEPYEILGCWTDITLQKQAEERLRENEAKYRVLTENSLLGIILLKGNPPGIIYINPKWTEIFGYTYDEVLSFDSGEIWKTVHPEDRELVRQRTIDRLSGKPVLDNYQFRIIRKDGSVRWVEVHASKLPSQSEALSMAIYLDITDRKHSEEALLESEQRFHAAFMGSPLAVNISTLEDGVCIDANQAEFDIFGYPREEVIGKSTLYKNIWFDPVDRKWIVTALNRGEEVKNRYCMLRHKDGHVIMASVSATALTLKGVKHILFITEDITEQKQAEDALMESEAKHRLLFEHANDAIFIHDTQARILAVNTVACQRHGYTHSEMMSLSVPQLIPPEQIQNIPERIARLMDQGRLTFETTHICKNGAPIPTEVSAKRITWEGRPAIMSICRDITERKDADEKMKAAMKEKETLLREIHHRVKNNMQVISSLLFLQSTRTDNERAKHALMDSQQRILSMAMIHESLYGSENLSVINLSAYLKRLVHHLQGIYSNHAAVRIDLELDNIEVNISQAVPCSLIFNELITNAFKHAFPDGRKGVVQIRMHLSGQKEVMLEVRDNGAGFSPDVDSAKPASLGLMLVQRLVNKQLRGNLGVNSSIEGTTFKLQWPLPRSL